MTMQKLLATVRLHHAAMRHGVAKDAREDGRRSRAMRPGNVFLVATLFLLAAVPSASAQGSCTWSSVGGGVASGVAVLTVFDDGTGSALYAGGLFTTAGGVSANSVAKWDGVSWSALGRGMSPGAYGADVRSLTVFDDGTGPALYAGGFFSTAGFLSSNGIAKWDGILWSPLGIGMGGIAPTVRSLTVFDDGSGPALYAGGSFGQAGGISANRIAKWDGVSWSPLGSGLTGEVYALTVFDDGTGPALYAGGFIGTVGGVSANGIAKWDGSSWSPLGSGVAAVFALTVYDDGTGPALYTGGVSSIAKWDGASWSPLGGGPIIVLALTVFDDGTGPALYAGSWSTSGVGVPPNNISKWDGASWSALVGSQGPVYAMTVFDDGTGPALYGGGGIFSVGGVPANRIVKWSCGSTISVSATQLAPGAPVYVNNANLTPGNEYYNIFSFDLCPGGAGPGPFGGLCTTTSANLQFMLAQLMWPLDTSLLRLFHFTAPSSYVNWGPLTLPPITLEAITFDFTGGVLGPISQVATVTVQ